MYLLYYGKNIMKISIDSIEVFLFATVHSEVASMKLLS
jgi:hypothetical protein